MAESLKVQLARSVIKEFPSTPHLTLAKKLYRENPEVYKDTEDARSAIRRIKGAHGDRLRKEVKDKSMFQAENRPFNPFKLPESEEASYEPYIIKGHKRIFAIGDVHLPYHSIDAVTLAIKEAKKEKVDGVLIGGDLLDFYQLSRYDKDPRKRSFAHELESARQFLEVLQKQLKCKIYFKLGNHEERYEKHLRVKAPELLGVADFELKNLLRLSDYNCDIIEDRRVIKLNKLNAIHGHEYPSVFSPVNIARGLFMKGKVSAIQFHNHTTSEHTEPNMNNEITTTWSVACLCELNPQYMPLNKWNHGFALIDLDENGTDYHVRNKRIYKEKVL